MLPLDYYRLIIGIATACCLKATTQYHRYSVCCLQMYQLQAVCSQYPVGNRHFFNGWAGKCWLAENRPQTTVFVNTTAIALPCLHLFWGNCICGIGNHPASSCFGLLQSVDNNHGTTAYSMQFLVDCQPDQGLRSPSGFMLYFWPSALYIHHSAWI